MFIKMEWDSFGILTITLVLLVLIYILIKYRAYIIFNWTPRFFELLKDIPRPGHVFGFGVGLKFQGGQDKCFDKIRECVEMCPRIFTLWIFNYATVHMMHPDDVEKVLTNKPEGKSVLYQFLSGWLHNGLLLSAGPKWQHRRKLLNPAFNVTILKEFTHVFAEQSFKVVEKLQKDAGGSPIYILNNLTEYTLNAITETSMGYRQEPGEDPENRTTELKKYSDALQSYTDILFHNIFRPWLHCDIISHSSLRSAGRTLKKSMKILTNFSRNIIKKHYETKTNTEDTETYDNDGTVKKRLNMLDLLNTHKLDGSIDEAGIAEEFDSFIFAGHETTATTLMFLFMILANHRDIQDRAYEEVINVMGADRSKLPNYNDLQNMVYLERCIKEGLRLYPPVWMVGRHLDEDVQLKDHLLPATLDVYIHIFFIHRNPEFWPNPTVFDPDRFLPENTQKRHPFAFIPFSAGARNCIGQKYAMLEAKALAATVLRHFILEPVDTPETITLMVDLILKTKNGVKIKVVSRP